MAKPVSASCLGDGDPQPLDVQAETDTEVVARTIGKLIRCDVHRIRAADPYPYSYEETVARNVREQQADARPRIANPLASIKRYDVVLLASPIWN
jgi:Flavodoxin